MTDPYTAALFAAAAFCAAFLACLAALLSQRLLARRASESGDRHPVVVIENGCVSEANFDARQIIDRQGHGQQLASLRTWLSRHFDSVAQLTADAESVGDMRVQSRNGKTEVLREICANAVRLTVTPAPEVEEDMPVVQAEDLMELATLRANTALSPHPLWRTNPAGAVVWMNQAYYEAGIRKLGLEAMQRWPVPHLFEEFSSPGKLRARQTSRQSLCTLTGAETHWYDCSVIEVDGDLLYTAINVDDVVLAEERLREVTQTLTKTFANLTIGLAVFDRKRNLTLFNPALTELTTLSVEFLASRPALSLFLDALREERMMPEPRDYKTWRDDLIQLEEAATDGTFEETWIMPGSQTWRVTGRPHPDGAIAILFEDISIEMSLTRRFHKELEQSQEILDMLDDAVAVFGIEGTLTHSNTAYRRLWHSDGADELEGQSVLEATRRWHDLTSPTPVWGDFRDFADETRDRLEWSADVRLLDGRALSCRFTPMTNGATLVRFGEGAALSISEETEIRAAV